MNPTSFIPTFYNVQEALHSGSPFRLSQAGLQSLDMVLLNQLSKHQQSLLHNALLLSPDLPFWQIETELDLQFIINVMKQHQGLNHLTLNFVNKMDFEELARTIISNGPIQIKIEKSGVVIDLILTALQSSKKLTHIEISFDPEPHEYKHIANAFKNERLTSIEFTMEGLFDSALWTPLTPVLSTHESIREMKFNSYGDDAGLQALGKILEQNRSIEVLHLDSLGYLPNAQDTTALCTSLLSSSTLKSLYLGQAVSGGVKVLFKHLADNQIKLTDLSLRDPEILVEDMTILKNSLKTNTSLTSLYLTGLVDDTCQILCQGLKQNITLKSLKLNTCYLTVLGVTAICDWLNENDTLTSLDLTRCNINDDGCQLLAQMLLKNKSLIEFAMSNNSITNRGVNQICRAVVKNTKLKRLMIAGHKEGDEPLTGVKDVLTLNKTLRHLEISLVSDQEVDLVCEGFKQNDTLTSLSLYRSMFNPAQSMTFFQKISTMVQNNFALDSFKLDRSGDSFSLYLQRNRALKSQVKYKVVILSHNIARSQQALSMLPIETWMQILSSVTHPGMDKFDRLVRKVFDSYCQ